MKLLRNMQLNAYAYLFFRCKYEKEMAVEAAKNSVAGGCTAMLFVVCLSIAIVLASFSPPPERPDLSTGLLIKLCLFIVLMIISGWLYRYLGKHEFDPSEVTSNSAKRREIIHYLTFVTAFVLTMMLVIGAGYLNGYIRSILG